jgi:hypothetical protein
MKEEKMVKEYLPHEQRVIAEREELMVKLNDLNKFIGGSTFFEQLENTQKNLLIIQQRAMETYATALKARIDLF